jgi:hypothetical protein
MQGIEQRRAPRIAVDLPARYRAGDVALDGRVGNLSQDGLFFHTPFLDGFAGDEVAVEVDLPDSDEPLALSGEVRWVDDTPLHSGIGIRFTNVAIKERLLLANFVIRKTYPPRT